MKKMCRGSATNSCRFRGVDENNSVVIECTRIRVPHNCTSDCIYNSPCDCVDLPLEYLMKEILDEEN